jgi:hypothetical protein
MKEERPLRSALVVLFVVVDRRDALQVMCSW